MRTLLKSERDEILQGTLDMLVLRVVDLEPMHGWRITEVLDRLSERALLVGQGTLYPALYRLERQGLIESTWRQTENHRRARFYAPTAEGRQRLARDRDAWARISRAINLVLA